MVQIIRNSARRFEGAEFAFVVSGVVQ
jgi:hypothetical protein